MLLDYHVHCDYSDDSFYPMENVIKDAIKKGITELCFTDHVDYGILKDRDETSVGKKFNVDYPNYFKDIAHYKEKYASHISIKKGLEFGMQTHTIPAYQKLYASHDLDFVLLSVHQINDQEFWTGDFQRGKSDLACYRAYYDEIFNVMSSYKDYSCLAHLDLMRRYVQDQETDFFDQTQDQIERILRLAIEEGKGIEINTSNVRYKVPGLTPSIEILKLYKKLGGRIITVGSDSHQPDHLGYRLQESMALLKELGYTHVCSFEKMNPIFHPLV